MLVLAHHVGAEEVDDMKNYLKIHHLLVASREHRLQEGTKIGRHLASLETIDKVVDVKIERDWSDENLRNEQLLDIERASEDGSENVADEFWIVPGKLFQGLEVHAVRLPTFIDNRRGFCSIVSATKLFQFGG